MIISVFVLFPLLSGLKINIWGVKNVFESEMDVGRWGKGGGKSSLEVNDECGRGEMGDYCYGLNGGDNW